MLNEPEMEYFVSFGCGVIMCGTLLYLDQNHRGPGLSKQHNTMTLTAMAKSLRLSVQMCRQMRLSTEKELA